MIAADGDIVTRCCHHLSACAMSHDELRDACSKYGRNDLSSSCRIGDPRRNVHPGGRLPAARVSVVVAMRRSIVLYSAAWTVGL